jgi:hypothetical protein
LTLAIVSDTDEGPGSEAPQRFQAEVVNVEPLDKVPSKDDVIASAITNFKDHVQTVFSFLKRAGTLQAKLAQLEKAGQDTTELSPQYKALKADLQFYITRTCFQKILTRAGYHCAAIADSKDEDQGQRSEGSSKNDFTQLLYPMSSWNKDHMKVAKGFGMTLSNIYRSVLGKEPFSFDMDKIYKGKDKIAEKAKFDPDMWTDDQWTQPEPIFTEYLRGYAPAIETEIWKHLTKKFKLEPIPKEKGFYLTADGRRAYHQLVTTCVWNALLYLHLLKKYEDRVTKAGQTASDIHKLTSNANWALHCLQLLAYGNPIIGIHLDWLDKKNPNNKKRKLNEVENPTIGDITGEEVDIVPSLERMDLDQSDGAAKGPSSRVRVSGGRGAAVLRWLRLITLHHSGIRTLLSTKTVLKLPQLSISLVQTGLPTELNEMQSLESYLRKMEKLKNDDINLVMETLRCSEREVEKFTGTYHCEAILLSLYLLHYETNYEALANAANESDFSGFYKSVGVDPVLAKAAGNFFTRVVAVSKRCCPVCNELFGVMDAVFNGKKPSSITGSHTTYYPCALPPFLPKKYADMVAQNLEARLGLRLPEYITTQRKKLFKDRGSASPFQDPDDDVWEVDEPEFNSEPDPDSD